MMFPQDSLYNPDEDMSRGSSSDFLPPGGGLAHSASSASFDAYSTTCTTDMDNVSLSSQDVGEEEDGALDELANDRPPSDYDSGSESDIESVDNEDGDDERCNDPGVSTSQTSGATDPAGDQIKSGKRKKSVKDGRQKKKKKSKRSFERRNIRKILADKDLEQNTLTAQQEELERKKRISEFKKNMIAQQEAEEKHSHLKSLLDDDQDSDCVVVVSTKRDVVVLSSDEDTKQDSSDDENSGSHVNDMLNKKNENGQVLVNVGHPDDEPDLFLAPQVAYTVKPHQIGGIRFLYDNLVESLSRLHSSPGFGCILAHSMGLGKTIQVVGFVDVLLRCTDMKKILIIVPINTLQNWVSEFNMWLPLPEVVAGISEEDVLPRKFTLHVVNDMHKTVAARAKVIEAWCEKGGVLLMGYEMYRLLSTRKARTRAKPFKMGKNKKPLLIDLDEEDRNQELQLDMQSALLDPGPDLIICDEGHRIKNSHAGISQALKTIRTRRRVVLTGYPLQNNLLEYWCMVDFVRPNFLGTKTEFCNMFERPINNGQCQDSTSKDVQLMRARAHVLHSLLEGFVQRRSHQVLKDALPPKEEYVLLVRMSPVQRVLYKVYMDYLENGLLATESTNPLKAFAVCCKIWNHPDILHRVIQHKQGLIADNDLDLADSESTKSGGDNDKKKKKKASKPLDLMENERAIKYDWAVPLMDQYSPNIMENGGKMVLLFNIIESTLAIGEKVLVFSQSLFTLSTIEEILSRVKVPLPGLDEKWERGKTYYRLDGSTSSMEREKLINQFNEPENKNCCLFLLSTRAGCLGINLVGANRVVVFDASWNPCHDCQAICRVYRYGQVRPCFIYRFVTDNTMEKKIYDRQVNKQGMSDRVVDELQPQNNFTRKEVDTLLQYEDKDLPVIDFQNCAEKTGDPVLCDVLVRNGHWITKEPFTHESLLIDRKDYKLSKAEKRIAKMAYEREKRLNVSYTRPSYSAFYSKPNQPPPPPPQPMLNPIYSKYYNSSNLSSLSSVRPMMSTPIPQPTAPPISRPGVSVQQIITTTEIVLPGTNTASNAGADKIAAGEKVFVIKTPKGVYLRTMSGRIFAVRKNAEKDGGGMVMSQACSGSTQPIMSSSDGPRSNSTSGGSMIQRVLQSTSGLSQQQQLPQQQLPQQQLPQQQLPQQQLPQQQSYLNHDIGMPTSHSELGSPSYPYGMPTMGFNSHPTTQALPASVELLNRQVSAYPGLSRYQMPVQPHDFMSSHNPPSSTQSDGFSSWSNSLLNQDQYNGYNGAPFSAVGSSHQDSVPMSQFPSLSSIGTTHSSSAGVPSDSILRSTLAQNITGYGSQAANCISKRGQPVQDNMTSYASRQSFDNPWSSSLSSPLGSNPSGVLNTIPVTATDSNEVMASAVVTNPSGVMNFAGVTNPSEIKTFGGVANRNGSMTSS